MPPHKPSPFELRRLELIRGKTMLSVMNEHGTAVENYSAVVVARSVLAARV